MTNDRMIDLWIEAISGPREGFGNDTLDRIKDSLCASHSIALSQLQEEFGFEMTMQPDDKGDGYYMFTRPVENGETHSVEIDIDRDKHDYILFSVTKDSGTDYFGHKIDEPYGLDGKIFSLFDRLAITYIMLDLCGGFEEGVQR